jgi:GalNAc-alpha-(1->4)-GalNAc-alpha-(1->3)-diNAcBac-PP-undecaprenol alpha-1,4-N-acetyl-D-galactosaminyltransferase
VKDEVTVRITFTIPSLGSGGSERVLTTLANYWAGQGWQVTLISLNDTGWDSFYELHPAIRWIRLDLLKEAGNTWAGLWNNWTRVRKLRIAIRESAPQMVVSFIDTMNVLTILAGRGLNVPIVISERSDPSKHNIGKFWNHLRMWTYPLADRLVVQNLAAKTQFEKQLAGHVILIPNPVKLPTLQEETPYLPSTPTVITVGRLSNVKGHDLLIRAFAKVKDRFPDWILLILGEGSQRAELEKLLISLNLQERVLLPGAVKNPYDYYRKAELFVLPSRYEGLPNALIEAMVSGLPVVATNCSAGVAEVICDGVDGILVPTEDVDLLSEAMGYLMADPDLRRQLGGKAAEVSKRYDLKKVAATWEQVFARLISDER